MNEYTHGFGDAIDLMDYHMHNCKDMESFKKTITDIVNRVKESKIVKLERELDLGE